MRIAHQDEHRMTLEGVPQGRGMVFALVISLAITVVAGLFTWVLWSKSGKWTSAIGPGLGMIFGLFLTGAMLAMMLKRERLVLDLNARKGVHTTWSLLFGSPRQVSFEFEKVHGISIQRTFESSGGGRGFPIRVTKARLLLVKPRRAIDLDEVQNANTNELESLARRVADFIGVGVEAVGSHDN